MGGLNIKVSSEVEKRLSRSQRIINLKLPSYGNDFCGQLFLKKYIVYHYDLESKKIVLKKSLPKTFIGFLKWLLKCIVFVLEVIFPIFCVSPSSILALSLEAVDVGHSFIENFSKKDLRLLRSLSKHIKIRKQPRKKYKKIKKVLYILIDEKISTENMAILHLLIDLIEAKYICDCSLVLLSKIKLIDPPQEIIDLYGDEERNQFVADFRASFLEYLLNENYVEATKFIKELINEHVDLNANEFEFIIQCLAFCYKNLNENEFIALFEDSNLNICSHLDFGKTVSFIKNSGRDKNFLHFCYVVLEKYYRNRPRISQDDLNATFQQIVANVKNALTSKDEFLSAVKLFAKYSSCEETVDSYIVASVHTEYVKNCINDECVLTIKEYEDTVSRAKVFGKLIAINEEEAPDSDTVQSLFNSVCNFHNVDPIVQLCFMYYLVNPVYKCNCCSEGFINYYKKLFNQALENQSNLSLLCLFAAQFLLLYTTVENIEIHKKSAKFSSMALQFVSQNEALLDNKKVYYKIIRSINGISVDCYGKNLKRMQGVENKVAQYVFENIYFKINLGALYAYNTNYKSAYKTYKDVETGILKKMPLSIRASFFNNYEVFRYLKNPSVIAAQKALKNINAFLSTYFKDNLITEEFIHLKINHLVFSIIVNNEEDLEATFESVQALVSKDNYFRFYYQQAVWLYSILKGKRIEDESLEESVFFANKKSFFQHKREALNDYLRENPHPTLPEINNYIVNRLSNLDGLDYFKRAELFSLVERWYE